MTQAMAAEDSKKVNANITLDPDNVESGPEPDVASIERVYRYVSSQSPVQHKPNTPKVK